VASTTWEASPTGGDRRPRLEVADIFRAKGEEYRRSHRLSHAQRKVMSAIESCRTPALGGHLDVCRDCGTQTPAYNSCRNRHCPKCQSLRGAKWVQERLVRVLPTHHFHVVFTVPDLLHPLAKQNREWFFNALFAAAAASLQELAQDPRRLGGQVGISAVLHTWTRDLRFHPHVHCVVTGGGLSLDGERWLRARQDYLFPVKVLGALFRGKLLAAVREAWSRRELSCAELEPPGALGHLLDDLYSKKWVVYSKPPFAGPQHVFSYLGRYTHRIGISNHRLLSFDQRGVCFITRGTDSVVLAPDVFIGRFLQHVLPDHFVKIRHYGLLAPANVNSKLARARSLLTRAPALPPWLLTLVVLWVLLCPLDQLGAKTVFGWRQRLFWLSGTDPRRCSRCGGELVATPLPQAPQIWDSS
jgi:hypothetical protein